MGHIGTERREVEFVPLTDDPVSEPVGAPDPARQVEPTPPSTAPEPT